jgi:hypothetical protein
MLANSAPQRGQTGLFAVVLGELRRGGGGVDFLAFTLTKKNT